MARIHDRSPGAVRNARTQAKLTQEECASMIEVSPRAWQHYESGSRLMPAASWELFLLKCDLHPSYKLTLPFRTRSS